MSAKRFLTAADYRDWKQTNGAGLQVRQAINQAAVMDAVVLMVIQAREAGVAEGDVGKSILRQFTFGTRGGILYTRGNVKRALRELGLLGGANK
jgi:hypothetical protein